MKNWKRWLVALWSAWLLLAYIFAWQRATCGQPWETACWVSGWYGLGDVILLTWVKDYQDLLAGLAALGGGAAVVIAYRMQARDNATALAKAAKLDAINACNLSSQRFIDLAYDIAHGPNFGTNFNSDIIVASYHRFSTIDTMLATVTMATLRDVLSFVSVQPTSDNRGRHVTAAECYAIARILDFVGNNLDDTGTFDFKGTVDIPPATLWSHLAFLAVKPEALGTLRLFFDWNNRE